jgi:hypothetical protein
MHLAWGPLILAGICAIVAVTLYLTGKAPRVAAAFTGAALPFLVAGVPFLLALAHRPITGGPLIAVIAIGGIGSLLLFVFIMFKGHHKKPLFKRKGGGNGGGGSPKAEHHRAMAATAAAVVFAFLLASHWSPVVQMGKGGFSQTWASITGGGA